MTSDTNTVYVVVPQQPSHIAARSAVVTADPDHENVQVYYEGGLYQPSMSFVAKLLAATGRLLEHYPTIARTSLARTDLRVVATFQSKDLTLDIHDAPALTDWSGQDTAVILHALWGARLEHQHRQRTTQLATATSNVKVWKDVEA